MRMSRQKPSTIKTLRVPALHSKESRNVGLKTAGSKESPRTSPLHTRNEKLSARAQKSKCTPEEEKAKKQYNTYTSSKTRIIKPKFNYSPAMKSPRKAKDYTRQKMARTPVTLREPKTSPKKAEGRSTDLTRAEMQILKSSMMMENRSCENIRVGIRVRPFTLEEEADSKVLEAWSRSPDGKLLDKKKGIIYGFGLHSNNDIRQSVLVRTY